MMANHVGYNDKIDKDLVNNCRNFRFRLKDCFQASVQGRKGLGQIISPN